MRKIGVYYPSRFAGRAVGIILAAMWALQGAACSKSEPSAPPAPVGPTLTAISPTSGVRGTTVTVTLTGSNFEPSSEVAASGGLAATNSTVVSSTSMTASVFITPFAALGDAQLSVTTGTLVSVNLPFTVLPPRPTLTSVSPNVGAQGTTVAVTLAGTNFVSGATTVAVGGAGVTPNSVAVVSGTSLTVNFVVAAGAALGDDLVTVSTAGGTSVSQVFTVKVAPLTSIRPKGL